GPGCRGSTRRCPCGPARGRWAGPVTRRDPQWRAGRGRSRRSRRTLLVDEAKEDVFQAEANDVVLGDGEAVVRGEPGDRGLDGRGRFLLELDGVGGKGSLEPG